MGPSHVLSYNPASGLATRTDKKDLATPTSTNLLQPRALPQIKPEQINDKMDKMLDELRTKIFHSSHAAEDEEKDKQQTEQADNSDDYFLGKRFNLPEADAFFYPDDMTISKRKSKKEEKKPVPLKIEIPPSTSFGLMETETPRPALNIDLIDSTYQYKTAIASMWDGLQTPLLMKDISFSTPGPLNEGGLIEFSLKEEFN